MPEPSAGIRPLDDHLRLKTLGTAALVDDRLGLRPGQSVLSGKALALLIYLTCTGSRLSREHLSDLLWADLEPDSARHALRQTVWYLRKRLGEDITVASGSDVGLVREIDSDRAAFLTALTHQARRVSPYIAHFKRTLTTKEVDDLGEYLKSLQARSEIGPSSADRR